MTTEPEDFTSESIRRKALSAAIDDLTRTYDALQLKPRAVISIGAFGRLARMKQVLKAWIMPDPLAAAAPLLLDALVKWETFMLANYKPEDISWWNETRAAIVLAHSAAQWTPESARARVGGTMGT